MAGVELLNANYDVKTKIKFIESSDWHVFEKLNHLVIRYKLFSYPNDSFFHEFVLNSKKYCSLYELKAIIVNHSIFFKHSNIQIIHLNIKMQFLATKEKRAFLLK